jgi:hypothetical protein
MSELFRGQPLSDAESERRRKVRERSQRRRDKAKAVRTEKFHKWQEAMGKGDAADAVPGGRPNFDNGQIESPYNSGDE